MSKSISPKRRKANMFYPLAMIMIACLVLLPAVSLAELNPTSEPYETRPEPDGNQVYLIEPSASMKIEKDVMVAMTDGVELACNIYRPNGSGKFPVVLAMTPYKKDQTPPTFDSRGYVVPESYDPYVFRVYSQFPDLGHMYISMETPWEGPDPAFWVPNGYAVIIVDQRGTGKSPGIPNSGIARGEDIKKIIEWAADQKWCNGNVGMAGVSALAGNQYDVASLDAPPTALKAIIPWEGVTDRYRDMQFWGGIPETNFSKRGLKPRLQTMAPADAAELWANAIDPVLNQGSSRLNIEAITVPALICASWSDKGLHTRGSFESFRRIGSIEKWLFTHGGKKWDRFYSEEGLDYQLRFFDHYLKGEDNGWEDTPAVRLEVRETADEYDVYYEEAFPLPGTEYKKLYLNAVDGSLSSTSGGKGTVAYNSTAGGNAAFSYTFEEETELTGYMKVKLWVSATEADDMDLFVTVKKFAGPCDLGTDVCNALENVIQARPSIGRIAKGNEIQFRGMNGFSGDMAARGQMRVSLRELDPMHPDGLSTDFQPVQKFDGEQKLEPGEIVEVEIALLPSTILFRPGESLSLIIQGYCPVHNTLPQYDWLVNKGEHVIHTGANHKSYLQIPVISR